MFCCVKIGNIGVWLRNHNLHIPLVISFHSLAKRSIHPFLYFSIALLLVRQIDIINSKNKKRAAAAKMINSIL